MSKPHGIAVQLLNQTQTGRDAAHRPIYTETAETVENVIVGSPTTEEIRDTLDLTGKRIAYWLGIPKGDNHVWEDRNVILPTPFSGTYRTIGFMQTGIQDLIPLDWGGKIAVERYGGEE